MAGGAEKREGGGERETPSVVWSYFGVSPFMHTTPTQCSTGLMPSTVRRLKEHIVWRLHKILSRLREWRHRRFHHRRALGASVWCTVTPARAPASTLTAAIPTEQGAPRAENVYRCCGWRWQCIFTDARTHARTRASQRRHAANGPTMRSSVESPEHRSGSTRRRLPCTHAAPLLLARSSSRSAPPSHAGRSCHGRASSSGSYSAHTDTKSMAAAAPGCSDREQPRSGIRTLQDIND